MLADSAHIQEKDAEFLRRRGREAVEPLYGMADVPPLMQKMVGVPYDKTFDVNVRGPVFWCQAAHHRAFATKPGVIINIFAVGITGYLNLLISRNAPPSAGQLFCCGSWSIVVS